MLSIATAATHRSMRPKTPSPTSSPDSLVTVGAGHPWTIDHTPSPKRRRSRQGPCSARKKIIPSPVKEVPLNFSLNNSEITLTLIQKDSCDTDHTRNKNVQNEVTSKCCKVNDSLRDEDTDTIVSKESDWCSTLPGKRSKQSDSRTEAKSVMISFMNSNEISIKPISKGTVHNVEGNATDTKVRKVFTARFPANHSQQMKSRLTQLKAAKPFINNITTLKKPWFDPEKMVKLPESDRLLFTAVNSTKTSKKAVDELSEVSTLKAESHPVNSLELSDNINCKLYDDALAVPMTYSNSSNADVTQNVNSEENEQNRNLNVKMSTAIEYLKTFEKNSQNANSSMEKKIFNGESSEQSANVGVIDDTVPSKSDEVHAVYNNFMETRDAFENDKHSWDSENAVITISKEPDQLYDLPEMFVLTETDLEVPYYMMGFPNPPGENRCWLNATLHALFVLPLFDNLDKVNLHECSQLTKTLIAMQVFWKKGVAEKQKIYQTVKMFKEELGILDESYPSERQQDVSEFLTIFLNYIKTDFDKVLASDVVVQESENIPENQQNSHRIPKTPQSVNKRQPLGNISMSNGSLKRGQNLGDSSSSPKPRKQLLTYGVQDLLSPKAGRLSNPTDPSYKVHTPPQVTNVNEESISYRNPIDEYFLLHMMEHYVCKGCMKHRQKKVDNLMLYVDVPVENDGPPVNLDVAIKKTLAPEERSLICGTCKYDTHSMRTTFRRCPRVLIVQVNRYGMIDEGVFAKISTAVNIPESLQLGATLVDNTFEDTSTYEPVCIITHAGSSMDCGHYTSYVKHGDQWFHYNDMNVMPMTSKEALSAAQSTAYLIFFVSTKLLFA